MATRLRTSSSRRRAAASAVRCGYQRGQDLGGTWCHNRYRGCRFDSESYTYCYSFSDELLEEWDWDWSEEFAPRAETLRYLNHVADKFDLRKHMRFGCRVARAVWSDEDATWTVHLDDGRALSCRFLMSAIGVFSAPTMPDMFADARDRGATTIEPTEEAEDEWCRHVEEMYDLLLLGKVKSWFTGYNSNVEGHDSRRLVVYNGGAPRYRRRLAEVAERDYEGFVLA